jgi:hypothetical protein
LRAPKLVRPPRGNKAHEALQALYRKLLTFLYEGYAAGLPSGVGDINKARNTMFSGNGNPSTGATIAAAANAVADAGFLVAFDLPADPRFAAVDHP